MKKTSLCQVCCWVLASHSAVAFAGPEIEIAAPKVTPTRPAKSTNAHSLCVPTGCSPDDANADGLDLIRNEADRFASRTRRLRWLERQPGRRALLVLDVRPSNEPGSFEIIGMSPTGETLRVRAAPEGDRRRLPWVPGDAIAALTVDGLQGLELASPSSFMIMEVEWFLSLERVEAWQ